MSATSRGIDQGDIHQLSRGANGGQLDQTTRPCTPSSSWSIAMTSSFE